MIVGSLAQGVPFGRLHTLYLVKKNIVIIHNCWLARSRGAFWEVSYFIPGKKIFVLNMIDSSLAQGVPFGRFHTLYLVNKT